MPSRTPYHMLMRALPLAKVGPGSAALVLIDVQAFTASRDGEMAREAGRRGITGEFDDYFSQVDAALRNIPKLIAACREAGIAIAHVRVSRDAGLSRQFEMSGLARPEDGFDASQDVVGIVPGADDWRIRHGGYSAFGGTDLEYRLHSTGIGTVLIAGMMSNVTVALAAREAADRNFDVLVVSDASPAETIEWHASTMQGLTGGAIRVISTPDAVDIIAGRKS
jgi:nicotinamidase-related amidase